MRYIVVSTIADYLCRLASIYDPKKDRVLLGGTKNIQDAFEQALADKKASEMLILQHRLTDTLLARRQLEALSARGVRIDWFVLSPNTDIAQCCSNLPGVRYHEGTDNDLSAGGMFPGSNARGRMLRQQLADLSTNEDLIDFLRYKNAMCMMHECDVTQLIEAVDVLQEIGVKPFSLDLINREDRASVHNFRESDFPYIAGHSAPTLEMKRRIIKVAQTEMSVLILGETGTGKEFVAFYLHEFSKRRSGPFVTLNCAGLDETFLRSELFGHEKGAFTGATKNREGLVTRAEGGTIFLDEIGDMAPPIQADLLRFLQTRRYRPLGSTKEKTADVRFVAATHPSLAEKIEQGDFRRDLYYRIAEYELTTPPLSAIPDDIIRIVREIAYRHVGKVEIHDIMKAISFFVKNENRLRTRPWPGNVRELVSFVRRKLLLDEDPFLASSSLDAHAPQPAAAALIPEAHAPDEILTIDEVNRRYVRHVWAQLDEFNLTHQQLADRLGKCVNTVKKMGA